MALRRIQKEAKDLEALMRRTVNAVADDAPEPVLSRQVVGVVVDPEDPHHWTVTVEPTAETCLSVALFGVEVTLCIRFPQDYPFKPFVVTFDDVWLEGVNKGLRQSAWIAMERSVRSVYDVSVSPLSFAEVVGEAAGRQRERRALVDMAASGRKALEAEWLDAATAIAAVFLPPSAASSLASVVAAPPPSLPEDAAVTVAASAAPAAAPAALSAAPSVGSTDPMRIHVKTLTGRVLTFDHLAPSTTTEVLRLALEEREGVPAKRMRLIYAGKQMEDGRTLADYGVRPDATIHLIIRMLGCQSALLGADGVLKGADWSPTFTICTLLRTLNESLFAAVPPESGGSSCRCHLRPLLETHATLGLVQWAARCSSPARGVVWSPSNDARWPLLFRKIVRYVRRIAVRAESHATRRTLPLDVVERIASYL